jgi:hypothetical protein
MFAAVCLHATAAPALAQESRPLADERGVSAQAFVRIPLGATDQEDRRITFGLGLYAPDGCARSAHLSQADCTTPPLRALEFRGSDNGDFGLWLTGRGQAQLFSFVGPGLAAQEDGAAPAHVSPWVWVGLGVGATVLLLSSVDVEEQPCPAGTTRVESVCV